jgi:3-mercaptopyruvate sulfurtransferase SseA
MPHRFRYLSIFLLAIIIFVGCNSVDSKVSTTAQKQEPKAGPETAYADGVRRITVKETQDLIKKGKAFVVDVRNQASYDAGHIPGAKLIPAGEVLNHLAELPRDKTIVTYCS